MIWLLIQRVMESINRNISTVSMASMDPPTTVQAHGQIRYLGDAAEESGAPQTLQRNMSLRLNQWQMKCGRKGMAKL